MIELVLILNGILADRESVADAEMSVSGFDVFSTYFNVVSKNHTAILTNSAESGSLAVAK